jgi:hypothetical protein
MFRETQPLFLRGMGINGFGRIGRLVFRAASGNPDAEAAVGLWCQRWKMAIEVVIFS